MPRFDYLCGAGHQRESNEARDTDSIECDCGLRARRIISPAHLPGVNGFTPKPTREHYVRLNQAVEAQHEIIHQAEKHHVTPPDFLQIAKDRIRRGDVVAIT